MTAMGGVLHTKASSDVSFVIVKNVLAAKYKVFRFLTYKCILNLFLKCEGTAIPSLFIFSPLSSFVCACVCVCDEPHFEREFYEILCFYISLLMFSYLLLEGIPGHTSFYWFLSQS